jgi:predicted transposase/invertase (TIGR01784 family)
LPAPAPIPICSKFKANYDKDIDPKVKEVWKMKFRPIDEVIREINIRDAREAGMEAGKKEKVLEIARNCLSNGVSPDIIAKSTGLPLEDIRGL